MNSALKGWAGPLAQLGLPRQTSGEDAFSLRIQRRTPRPPGPLSLKDGGRRQTTALDIMLRSKAQPSNFANRTLPPPSANFDGRRLGSGARVSFAKPTKDGRNHSPSLDGGWGVRPTEEESGSARARKAPASSRHAL